MPKLLGDHIGEPRAAGGDFGCELLIEHAGIGFLRVGIEHAGLGRRVAHALQDHLHEQRFELTRRLLDRRLRVVTCGAPHCVERTRIGRETGAVDIGRGLGQIAARQRVHRLRSGSSSSVVSARSSY